MKKIFFALCISILFLYSCNDSTDDIGLSIIPQSDEINVKVDTFHINTSTYIQPSIYSNSSLFSIGQYDDDTLGITKADLLAQVIYPSSTMDVSNAIADEMSLVIYYTSFVGLGASIEFKAYEMTQLLDFRTKYYSDFTPNTYTNLLGSATLTAAKLALIDSTIEHDSIPRLTIPFSQSFAQTFLNDASIYTSEASFKEFFKGVFISSENGNGIMLSVDSVGLVLKYHKSTDPSTTITALFPASNDVKQVNVFSHPGIQTVLDAKKENIEYLFTPAGFFANAPLPIANIKERLGQDKTIALNSVKLKVEAESKDDVLPLPDYLLLIKKDSINQFFEQNELPDSKKVFLARLDTTTNAYNFDLTYYMQKKINNLDEVIDVENMVLVPVSAYYSSSALVSVKQSIGLSVLRFKNKNNASPLKLNIIYNEFFKQ